MRRFICNEEGQGFVEYALIILLAVLVLITAVTMIGNNTAAFFRNFAEDNF